MRRAGVPLGRLRRRQDFVRAAQGRRFHTDRLTVQGLRREDTPEGLRLGITVTKRVGHATERNRIRRRLRSALGEAAAGHAREPADVVVIARRDCLGADYGLLVAELGRALATVTRPKPPRAARSQTSAHEPPAPPHA